ncbi:Potassium transporter [Cladophialophora chaetospira]|uniref:Potassium transporter n=1 Tax=Cladophialophora chaetospira TaxID=386627 RepID=A0AA38X5I8_9EURO|nr:Potassium transporter [Cladophialophora chaetospira]
MGLCGGEREKFGNLKEEQKWDYINLDEFKSSSCWTGFAYGYLLVMLIVSISVYAVDTFTAINLLVFDKWAGQIKPEIPLNISRWIFAGCIILSFILLVYRWMRAIRVMRQGGVAKSYLDPLAVRVQSIRWGKGRGWKRFLVFAELTKSRKGADYVALFTYFSFEAWLRIVFAEGPRQVVNALTLYSVLRLKLVPEGQHAPSHGHSPVVQFFVNIGILADSNHLQAVILFGMLWTLVIWVISVISLMVSVVLYLVFLWHHIPTEDGGLTGYCRNKINRRMERVVRAKVEKALKKENAIRARQEALASRDGTLSDLKKQPTLPSLGDDDSLPSFSRTTTMTTLPEYTSRPGTGRNSDNNIPTLPTLPGVAPRPAMPSRTVTHGSAASWTSYKSDAPLMGNAEEMGFAPDRAQTPGSEPSGGWYGRPAVNRSVTNLSQPPARSFSPALPRPGTAQSDRIGAGSYQMDPLPRPGTSMSNGGRPRYPSDQSSALPYPDDRGSTPLSQPIFESPIDMSGRRTPTGAVGPAFPRIAEEHGRMSPLPGPQYQSQAPNQYPPPRSFTPQGMPPARSMTPNGGPTLPRLQTSQSSNYVPYSADRSMTPASSIPPNPTMRSFTEPTRTYSPFGQQPRLPNLTGDRPPPQRQGSRGANDILDLY